MSLECVAWPGGCERVECLRATEREFGCLEIKEKLGRASELLSEIVPPPC